MPTMIYDTLHERPFSSRLRYAGLARAGVKCALLLWCVALLSTVGHAQAPATVLVPYVLTNQSGTIKVVAGAPMMSINPNVGYSNIGGLLGGGFGFYNSAGDPLAAAGQAAAIASLRAVEVMVKANAVKAHEDQLNQDTQTNAVKYEQNIDACDVEDFKSRFGKKATSNGASFRPPSPSSRRIGKAALHKWKTLEASGSCMLPEEEDAMAAEEDLNALMESGDAVEEALEAAETAADVAEAAAEAAEVAAEALVAGLDVLDGILSALSVL